MKDTGSFTSPQVASLVEAWIEVPIGNVTYSNQYVASLVEAWIEVAGE